MQLFVPLACLAAVAAGVPSYGHQECHQTYETIVDTTYVEDCQDIVTQECHEVNQRVHHSSNVVGHDSQLIHGGHGGYGGHGYGKREADAEAKADPSYGHGSHGHTSGPQCQARTERQCQQRPVQNSRQVPREVCHEEYDVVVDTTYVQDCQDIVTQECHEVSQRVHPSSRVVGHDSQLIPGGHGGHAGYGYGKREADAEPEADASYGSHGHTSGPQCHARTERQCQQRPVQNSRKVPRSVCNTEYDTVVDTTYVQDCQDIVTQECHQVSQSVHHTSGVVGHNSQLIAGGHGVAAVGAGIGSGYAGHGYGKREAEAAPEAEAKAEPNAEADASYGSYGHSSGPRCQARTQRQCQQRPVQNSRQVPRQHCRQVAVAYHGGYAHGGYGGLGGLGGLGGHGGFGGYGHGGY